MRLPIQVWNVHARSASASSISPVNAENTFSPLSGVIIVFASI